MTICNKKHEEIVFDNRSCPLCDIRDEIDNLEAEINKLQEEINK